MTNRVAEAIRADMAIDPVVASIADDLVAVWDRSRNWHGLQADRPALSEVTRSVRLWRDEGFPIDLLVELVAIPMHRPIDQGGEWAYFAGTVWCKIRDARERVEAP